MIVVVIMTVTVMSMIVMIVMPVIVMSVIMMPVIVMSLFIRTTIGAVFSLRGRLVQKRNLLTMLHIFLVM